MSPKYGIYYEDALNFEENYFSKQARKHGKVRGKRGGKPSKNKFSDVNPKTFEKIINNKLKVKNQEITKIKDRNYIYNKYNFVSNDKMIDKDSYYLEKKEKIPKKDNKENLMIQLNYLEYEKYKISNEIEDVKTLLALNEQTITKSNVKYNLEEQVFPNWKNYGNTWTDDILHGIVDSSYPEWN